LPAAAELDEGGLGGRGTRPCVAPHGFLRSDRVGALLAMPRTLFSSFAFCRTSSSVLHKNPAASNFRDLHEAGYTADVLPISRPNWKPDPKSSLKLDQLGKIPAALDEQTGLCRGLVGWTNHRATVAHLKKYHT
jgi:hypothetical protein